MAPQRAGGRRVAFMISASAVALLSAGCGQSSPPAAGPSAAAPSATSTGAPDRAFLPSATPVGYDLASDVFTDSPHYEATGPYSPHLTVYADAAGVTGDGVVIAAAFGPGSDAGPSISQPRQETMHDVTVGGQRGWAGVTAGGETMVGWTVDNGTQEADVHGVLARGLTEDAVLKLAEATQIDADHRITIPTAALPAGLTEVAAGAAFPHIGTDLAAGFELTYEAAEPTVGDLVLSTYTADPALGALVDFVAGGEPTTVRGQPAVQGVLDNGGTGLAWTEDGLLAVVRADASLAGTPALVDFVNSLEIRPSADVLAVGSEVARFPPEHVLNPDEKLAATGPVGDDGMWAAGLSLSAGLQLHIEGRRASGEYVAGNTGSVTAGQAMNVWNSTLADGSHLDLVVVGDSQIAAVQLELADGGTVSLLGGQHVLDADGADFGVRVFGSWLEPALTPVSVTLFDAAGAVLVHRDL